MNTKLKVEYKSKIMEGILIKEDNNYLTLKLDNGYNTNLNKKEVKILETKEIELNNNSNKSKSSNVNKNSLPKVALLHTGGTIASKVDYKTGAVSSKFTPEELLGLFPEVSELANVTSKLVGNMWSQDMRFSHYNLIAKSIEKEIKNGAKVVIVSQGTDTLHYTSAALSFILEDLSIPVLVVGSQRSSDRPSSDAATNLINAIYFGLNSDFAEVGVCMHNNSSGNECAIIAGCRARKTHTSRRDAFKSINSKPFAIVDSKKEKIEFLRNDFNKKNNEKILKLKLFNEKIKVGILKQYTNMFAEDFLYFKNHDGLVIESTGLGNLPISENDELTKESGNIKKALNDMIKKGLNIILSPQTINGRLNLNVYENAHSQQDIGILGNYNDMTTETTFIKLAWLLSNYTKDETKDLMLKNLRGEISNKITFDEDF